MAPKTRSCIMAMETPRVCPSFFEFFLEGTDPGGAFGKVHHHHHDEIAFQDGLAYVVDVDVPVGEKVAHPGYNAYLVASHDADDGFHVNLPGLWGWSAAGAEGACRRPWVEVSYGFPRNIRE
jgi:hypothetical protein